MAVGQEFGIIPRYTPLIIRPGNLNPSQEYVKYHPEEMYLRTKRGTH
jgi:hypothetical protein